MKAKIKKAPLKKVVSKKPVAKKSVAMPKKSTRNFWLSFLGITNVIAFIAVVVVNYLATSLPI